MERNIQPSLLRESDRGGVAVGKILFVENTGTISSTKAEDDSPKAPKIRGTKWEKWITVKVGTLVREVKTTNPLTRRSSSAYKRISIIYFSRKNIHIITRLCDIPQYQFQNYTSDYLQGKTCRRAEVMKLEELDSNSLCLRWRRESLRWMNGLKQR